MWDRWLRRFLGRILKALNARLPLQYKKFQRKPASLIGETIFEYTSVQIIGVKVKTNQERDLEDVIDGLACLFNIIMLLGNKEKDIFFAANQYHSAV